MIRVCKEKLKWSFMGCSMLVEEGMMKYVSVDDMVEMMEIVVLCGGWLKYWEAVA